MNFFDFDKQFQNTTKFAIFGIPWDYLSTNKLANASSAPEKIREASLNLALTTELGITIPDLKVADIGDVSIESSDVNYNLDKIKQFIENLYERKHDIIPVMIGGDHFCSYPMIKSINDHYNEKGKLGVVVFDAHLDLYEEWDKSVYSHATVSHRIYDLENVDDSNLLIIGSRDIDIQELKIAKEENLTHFDSHFINEIGIENIIEKIISFFETSHIEYLYISIDIDVIDPSNAPGTGYAIPGGLTYRDLWTILRKLAQKFSIVGFDLVEVAPALDLPNLITLNIAAKLIIEFISFISNKLVDNHARK